MKPEPAPSIITLRREAHPKFANTMASRASGVIVVEIHVAP